MIIDPHIHMVSRTTDDYAALARHGIHVVTEPSFLPGYDRRTADSFRDYFRQLTEVEPARARTFGISHYCWIGLNPKEALDTELAREVIELLPEYLDRPTVLGIGEIGLSRNSRHEVQVLEWHLDLAARRNDLVLVHTPHLEDKLKGTRLIMDVIRNESRLDPQRIVIDHAEEHTVAAIKSRGFWAGVTLYPLSRCSPARAVDILEVAGCENIWLDSAAGRGVSDHLAVIKAADEMRCRGFTEKKITKILYENPAAFLGQSPRFLPPR